MNHEQAENLRILIRHMETTVQRELNMAMYFDEKDVLFKGEPCGTPACALGEAAFCPELAHLRLPRTNRAITCRMGMEAFGEEADARLFDVRLNGKKSVSPLEWAGEARRVLAACGYSMDTEAEKFAAFKAKLLEPKVLPLTDEQTVAGD